MLWFYMCAGAGEQINCVPCLLAVPPRFHVCHCSTAHPSTIQTVGSAVGCANFCGFYHHVKHMLNKGVLLTSPSLLYLLKHRFGFKFAHACTLCTFVYVILQNNTDKVFCGCCSVHKPLLISCTFNRRIVKCVVLGVEP